MNTPVINTSPHIRGEDRVRLIMADVLVALFPAVVAGCYFFGLRVLVLCLISVLSCMLFDALGAFFCGRKFGVITDASAAVSGLLLALCLPVGVPLWLPVMGAAFAMLIVKQLFGGLGKNLINPALAARVFLTVSFPDLMAVYTKPFSYIPAFAWQPTLTDAVTTATPLTFLNGGSFPADVSLMQMFLGETAGSVGEVSALMLLGGGLYLLYRRIITWQTPTAFLATVFLLGLLFPAGENAFALRWASYELFSGGVMLAAFFMITDYTTAPVTSNGRLLFGFGCGVLTFLIRRFGSYPEGVSFAVLIMNFLSWPLDRLTWPRAARRKAK
ncbi:MAG: RnfABCDGE type electron transport complex subunit D [Clostridia bacterium]|nr:RnfABCDGE type electron transport complex subunit D [Clostridia bacterium]